MPCWQKVQRLKNSPSELDQLKELLLADELEQIKTEMREKLNSEKGKAKYLERMSDVEPVFGNIIYNQKANNFLCRGKPKVKIEFGLSCIAHNLVKISNCST